MHTRKSSAASGSRRKAESRTPAYPILHLLPTTSLAGIHRLARTWNLDDWDVILAGDGSGQGQDDPCGWSSVLIDRHVGRSGGRKTSHGGMSTGTSWLAELLPYLQALEWYAGWRKAHAHARDGHLTRIAVVSDCKSLVDQGNLLVTGGKPPGSIEAGRAFWTALAEFSGAGFALRFHWQRRATFALNVLCDDLAGRSRLALSESAMRARLAAELVAGVDLPRDHRGRKVSVYDVNPDDDLEHGGFDGVDGKARKRASRAAG